MMTRDTPVFNRVLAFEVAKDSLVVHALPADRQRSIDNRPAAVRRILRAAMRESDEPLLVVCEASGGYERHVLDAACALDIACHRAHGARVRHFAKYLGVAAKTDAIDVRMIALYGLNTAGLRLYRPPTPEQDGVRALKTRRDEVQRLLLAEANRLERALHPRVRVSLRAHIRVLKRELADLEREIASAIAAAPSLSQQARLMQSVAGVGPATTAALIAYFPELGTLAKSQAARLAGLAPIARDSGKSSLVRHVEPGRAALRRALYMAAVVAMRHNPRMRDFALRLKIKGKPFKVVVTAVMRKLVVILNAVLMTGQPAHAA
jgi:transposase